MKQPDLRHWGDDGRCPVCNRPITRSPTAPAVEYGHQRRDRGDDHALRGRCPRRPDTVDSADPRRD
jgi:hypothetical protein